MAALNFYRRIGQMSYPTAGAGAQTRLELPRVTMWSRLHLHLYGTFDAPAVPTGTFGTENPQSLLRSVDVIANGSQLIKSMDGGTMYRNAHFHHGQPFDRTAGTAGATLADTEFNVHLVYDFAMPRSIRPLDTIMQANRFALMELRIVWGNELDVDGATAAGGGTYDLSDLVIDVAIEERISRGEVNAGIFKETMQSRVYTSLTGEQDMELPVGDFYRAITVKTQDGNGDVEDDLIELLTLYSGGTRFFDGVGWGSPSAATQLRGNLSGYNSSLYQFGDTASGRPPVGYRRLEFAPDGLLTESLDTSVLEQLVLRSDLGSTADTGTVSAVSHVIVNPAFVRA